MSPEGSGGVAETLWDPQNEFGTSVGFTNSRSITPLQYYLPSFFKIFFVTLTISGEENFVFFFCSHNGITQKNIHG